ncbi:transposase [Anopheles sinensis]|uniref:Transposase n=1 Tax=Anopheles sinensis TaxID=74873 RepID=A0A084VI90_ANOSI|nr:transposase [Anopheles sinensis]
MEDGGTDPENNNSSHCGMLGISMPCEGAGHDFSTVRKELEYANAIAAHYGAPSEKTDRVISYKIEQTAGGRSPKKPGPSSPPPSLPGVFRGRGKVNNFPGSSSVSAQTGRRRQREQIIIIIAIAPTKGKEKRELQELAVKNLLCEHTLARVCCRAHWANERIDFVSEGVDGWARKRGTRDGVCVCGSI